jgi:hypothetical protein
MGEKKRFSDKTHDKTKASRPLKKQEILAPSFDKLRMRLRQAQMRSRVFNGLALMVSLSRFVGLTVRPWVTSF